MITFELSHEKKAGLKDSARAMVDALVIGEEISDARWIYTLIEQATLFSAAVFQRRRKYVGVLLPEVAAMGLSCMNLESPLRNVSMV